MQAGLSTQKTVTVTQHKQIQHTDVAPINAISVLLVLLLPVVVIGAIVGYRKYQSMLMQRRVQRLNRMWQLDSSKNLS